MVRLPIIYGNLHWSCPERSCIGFPVPPFAGTCSLSYVVQAQTANDQEGTARTSFWIGVILSIVADAIVAVSLNVQKTAHMRNEVSVRTHVVVVAQGRLDGGEI